MLKIDRRHFLQASLCSLAGSSLAGISNIAIASKLGSDKANANGPLIVIFQRGGADGLAILSPLEDENFLASRPAEMRFNVANSSGKVWMGQAPFYWHPEAGAIAGLYQSKRLLAWNAVGITDETRSHFVAQEIMERGVQTLHCMSDSLGILTRLQRQSFADSSSHIPLFAGSNRLPRAMYGSSHAFAMHQLQGQLGLPNGHDGLKALQILTLADGAHPAAGMMNQQLKTMAWVQQAINANNRQGSDQKSESISYPNSDPGIGLRSLAKLIEMGAGVQYAWIDQGGWDTHEGQPGKINPLVKNLGAALLAFDQDMQSKGQPYTMIVLTEFGRRLKSNRSNGTDHGHGGLALMMGSLVPGGQVKGRWPGLDPSSLDRSVDLAVTTDYLEVFNQALSWHRAKS